MKKQLTILLMLCIAITQAQQSANAAGGNAIGSGGSASYSVGQVSYTAITGVSGNSYQGVQQPYKIFSPLGINNYPAITLAMSVFPNPTQTLINLKIENDNKTLWFVLYDLTGKIITVQKIYDNLTQVPMQNLAAGSYLLKVNDAEKELKTFKIIKNN